MGNDPKSIWRIVIGGLIAALAAIAAGLGEYLQY